MNTPDSGAVPPVLTLTLNPAIDLDLTLALLAAGSVQRALAAQRQAGGKGVNVARMLAELGTPATALCVAGGPDAAVYRALLRGAPFGVELLRVAQPVRTNLTLRLASGGGEGDCYKINQRGAEISPAEWRRIKRRFAGLAAGRRWVVLAGAPAPGLPPQAYAELTALAHAAGAAVALDFAGEPLRLALAERPELVKPNRDELAETLGRTPRGEADLWRALHELRAAGAGSVLVSAGGGACLLLDARGRGWQAQPPRVKPLGTLGAGDSLLAGYLAGLLRRKTPAQALALGLACGAATTALPDPRFGSRAQVRALLPQARVVPHSPL